MSEKILKVVPAPESKTSPDAATEAAPNSAAAPVSGRKRLRMILLVALPALAVLIGLGVYLMGGRYISTDNAYVGAQKVLITPDISGKVVNIAVREGQHVKAGDELFSLDPIPYQPRCRPGRRQARDRAHRFQQAQEQPHIAQHAGRTFAEECRAQAARCRPQDQAG